MAGKDVGVTAPWGGGVEDENYQKRVGPLEILYQRWSKKGSFGLSA